MMGQGKGVGEVWINRVRNIRDNDGGSDFAKNERRSRRWGMFFNGPCGLLLLVLLVLPSTRSPKGSSTSSSSTSPTSSLGVLVPLV